MTMRAAAIVTRAPMGPPDCWWKFSPEKVYVKFSNRNLTPISAILACISLSCCSVGSFFGKFHCVSILPFLEFNSLDFIPGATLPEFLFQGRMSLRQSKSPVYFLFTTIYLAPCLQSNPSIFKGLLRTCFLTILPVETDCRLGNSATTSRPSRHIS